MPARLALEDQMTIDEFLAFTEARPDGERWELIAGVAVMSPAPTEWHQRIALNIASALDAVQAATHATWTANLGVGMRVPAAANSLPQPDVFVKSAAPANSSITDDAIVLFEVLSRSNTKADQAWRKRVYASVPNCEHYVTVSTKTAEVTRYDRTDGWKGETVAGLDAELSLPALPAKISLRTIYRKTEIK